MIYRVLLVDDEPIILSGIKFLIDWEKNNCTIAGTARNGSQALEAIETLQPHIVICDISMPVMSGIDLVKTIFEKSPLPVFIMLTNYGEFDLARNALRCQVVDYLLKSQLEPENLENSLTRAKQEYEKRGGLLKVTIADQYIRSNQSQIIAQHLRHLMNSKKNIPDEVIRLLDEEHIFTGYSFIQLFLDYSSLPSIHTFSDEETARLYAWQQEVVEKLSGNTFPYYTVFDPDNKKRSLMVYCWNLSGNPETLIEHFYTKLCTVSGNITQLRLSLTATGVFQCSGSIADAISDIHLLSEHYYNQQNRLTFSGGSQELVFETISFTDISNKLVSAIHMKNIPQCSQLISQAADMVSQTYHRKKNAVKECTSLYSKVSSVLSPMLPMHQENDFFTDDTGVLWHITCLSTKKEVCLWLDSLSIQLERHLELLNSSKSDLAEKAKNYVVENIEKRILLQDVADYVNLSPNYLSALFKKEYNQNFVEFMNETKTERACALIEEGSYRMYEISYKLGFDNAYYFTKVFKKHTGMTPTEYQQKIHPATPNHF